MSWRRLRVLLAGLSAASVYQAIALGPGSGAQRYARENAADYFASFPRAGGR